MPVPAPTVAVYDAVDVYEFLKVMQGTPFLAEGDMERLLGKPYNVTKSPKGEIRTHVYTGGAVQYQLSKHNPRLINSLALKKATEQSRSDIKRGDFETASRLLRVREHREYCLLMLRAQLEGRRLAVPSDPEPDELSNDELHDTSVAAQYVPPTPSAVLAPQALQDTRVEREHSAAVDPYRTWTSEHGHKCRARFHDFEKSKVYLEKEDGSLTGMSLYDLIPEDQMWIREHLRKRSEDDPEKKVERTASLVVVRP